MKSVFSALSAAALSLVVSASPTVSSAPAARDGDHSFMGTNLYFLQGLSDADQDAYIGRVASAGAKVVRVWVNRQSADCEKGSRLVNDVPAFEEEALGEYRWETLDALDKVIAKIAAASM